MEPLYCTKDFESYECKQQLVEYYFVGSRPGEIVYDDGYSRKIIPNIDLLYGVENEDGEFSDNMVIGIRIKDFGKWGLIIDGDVVKDFEYDNIQVHYINPDTQEFWFMLNIGPKFGLYGSEGCDIPCTYEQNSIGVIDNRVVSDDFFYGEEQNPVLILGHNVCSIDGQNVFNDVCPTDLIGYINPETLVFIDNGDNVVMYDYNGEKVDFEIKDYSGCKYAIVSTSDEYAASIDECEIVENPFYTSDDSDIVGYFIVNIKAMTDEVYGNCIAVFANPVKNLGFGNMCSEGVGRDTVVFSFPETDEYIQPLVRIAQSEQIWHPNMKDFARIKTFEESMQKVVVIYKHRSLTDY